MYKRDFKLFVLLCQWKIFVIIAVLLKAKRRYERKTRYVFFEKVERRYNFTLFYHYSALILLRMFHIKTWWSENREWYLHNGLDGKFVFRDINPSLNDIFYLVWSVAILKFLLAISDLGIGDTKPAGLKIPKF